MIQGMPTAYPIKKENEAKGLCIIIDNDSRNTSRKAQQIYRKEVDQLIKIFQLLLGFHVECFVSISALAIRRVLENLDTFQNPSALIFIVLSHGKYPGVYDCHNVSLSKDQILRCFANEKFQDTFPKIVIFHTAAMAANEPLRSEDITVPVDCICAKVISSDDAGNSKLLELIHLLQSCTTCINIESVLDKVASVINNNLKKSLLLPIENKIYPPSFM